MTLDKAIALYNECRQIVPNFRLVVHPARTSLLGFRIPGALDWYFEYDGKEFAERIELPSSDLDDNMWRLHLMLQQARESMNLVIGWMS